MNYLMIDTAEGVRALLEIDGRTFYAENFKNAGSETLMPTVDGLLKQSGVCLSDIDIFGAAVGPGSFTGLRIGLTTIKTFCYALNKRCFAVNNLRMNSYNNTSDKVISIAAAGNKVCYIARYDGDNETDGARCVTEEDALEYIRLHPDYSVSTDRKFAALALAVGGISGIGEREMIKAAHRHMKDVIAYGELAPLYIRKAQPERGEGDL